MTFNNPRCGELNMTTDSPCVISFVSIYGAFIRRSVAAAGLVESKVDVDSDTTIRFWGPSKPDPKKPAIVFIHGFGPPAIWQWHGQVKFFSKKFNVYVPELVFFGESFTKSGERSEAFQATCVQKLLQKLQVSRYSVVGTSYGGFVAYYMAEMWPENVEKVVIASSAVNYLVTDKTKLLQRGNADTVDDLMLPVNADRTLYMENRKEKSELLHGMKMGTCETADISPLSQEVLIVWGEGDQVFLLEKAYDLVNVIGKKASLQVMKKAGHIPQLERTSKFNKILANFFSGLL